MREGSGRARFRDEHTRQVLNENPFPMRPPKRPSLEELQRQCDRFNAHYPVGSDVIRFPSTTRNDNGVPTKTRSEAWVMGGHSAMVMVEGHAGGVCLDCVGTDKPI